MKNSSLCCRGGMVIAAAAFLASLFLPLPAEEGMWTLDNPPLQQLQAKYGFTPNAAWLEDRTFWVPCHPVYEVEHMEQLGAAIEKVLTAYAK